MRSKVLDLDLSERIKTVWGIESYDRLYILVRQRGQPVGWVSISNGRRNVAISEETLRDSILQQLRRPLAMESLRNRLAPRFPQRSLLAPISVVICTRNRPDQLAECLRTILVLDYPRYDILVVDNAPSNDDTSRVVADLPVRYVREDRPGLDWARNRGIAEARHEIVAFTDDDVRVDRGWLKAIGAAFLDSEVMAVTGFIAPAELETTAQHFFEFNYGGMGKGFRRRSFRRGALNTEQLLWANAFGVGANMAFRRRVFDDVGLFDVALDSGTPTGGAGDLDMFHRIVTKGHTLAYEPSALVWHIHRRSAASLRQQIYDNGRSFGAYLLTCARNRTVSRLSILKFTAVQWVGRWILFRLLRPRRLPRRFVIAELMGALRGPLAYRAAQIRARNVSSTPTVAKPPSSISTALSIK
jgi:GT2 family glycosyltransferase